LRFSVGAGYVDGVRGLVVLLLVVAIALVCCAIATAIPAGFCKRVSAVQCEKTVGEYGATQDLNFYAYAKLRALYPDDVWGAELGCGATKHRGIYRCHYTQVQPANATVAPCKIEALIVNRRAPKPWRFAWHVESATCLGPSG